MEKVPYPGPLTREQIHLLNDGSMTLEEAAAKFNADLIEFKEILEKENIFVWNQVDGTRRRIHAGRIRITIVFSDVEDTRVCVVKGSYPFESVIRIIEEEQNLTRRCYKLSYKHSDAVGDVLIETDCDWHNAVIFFKSNAYIMRLDLKKIPDAGAGTSDSVA